MGDISRHRDIFLNTRTALPQDLLARCHLTAADLTYLELGNYLTDVSQFRDPVAFLFAKRGVWRESVLPKATGTKNILQGVAFGLGAAGMSALALAGYPKWALASGLTGGLLPALITEERLLDWFRDVDDWLDRMLGAPIDRVPAGRRRTDVEYGYLGLFFQYFIEGITHTLFSDAVTERVSGAWGEVGRIPENALAGVFAEHFTQYYPHEHTDQPPYVWDASERPGKPMYQVSRRQTTLASPGRGIMRAVDDDYLTYLAEQLTKLEHRWRGIAESDAEARRKALVPLGKILHGVEDWYFHSNVVELLLLRQFAPAQRTGEDDEAFARRFVLGALREDAAFLRESYENRVGLQRKLYRRLHYPDYLPGDDVNTGGVPSRETSQLRLDFAYPAFPSAFDTSNTLLGALEHLEGSLNPGGAGLLQRVSQSLSQAGGSQPSNLPGLACMVARFQGTHEGEQLFRQCAAARGIVLPASRRGIPAALPPGATHLLVIDVLREWIPLVLTLLHEDERRRLVAKIDPLRWTGPGSSPGTRMSRPGETNAEEDAQLRRHREALTARRHSDGITENNYERAIRLLGQCGFLSATGQAALQKAFQIDLTAEFIDNETPGVGGFLIKLAVQLQEQRDLSRAVTARLNAQRSIFDARTDTSPTSVPRGKSSAVGEVVGSHSLMSKDTPQSLPLFEETRTLASLASQTVLHLFLQEASSPATATGLDWLKVLQQLVRYPDDPGGWEAQALALFRQNGRIPAFGDVPALARLRESLRAPREAVERRRAGKKATDLEAAYAALEKDVAKYKNL